MVGMEASTLEADLGLDSIESINRTPPCLCHHELKIGVADLAGGGSCLLRAWEVDGKLWGRMLNYCFPIAKTERK